MTFKEKLDKLEEISKQMQNPETELEKAVELYEQGMKLAAEVENDLTSIERRIEIVTSPCQTDGITTEPYVNPGQ